MTSFSTDAIILHRRTYGDTDIILTVLAADTGKQTLIAKSAKKSVRRFSGALEPFTIIRFVSVNGRGRLPVLQEAAIAKPFTGIRCNVFKTAYAGFWTELSDIWLEENAPQPCLYRALSNALAQLNADAHSDLSANLSTGALINIDFLLEFLRNAGLLPNFDGCAVCGRRMAEIPSGAMVLQVAKGRMICPACSPESTAGRTFHVSRATMTLLSRRSGSGVSDDICPNTCEPEIMEASELLQAFLSHQMSRSFKSLAVLQQICRSMSGLSASVTNRFPSGNIIFPTPLHRSESSHVH